MMPDEQRAPAPELGENDKWGMFVLLVFLLGIPLVGIIYSMLTQ